MHKQVSYWTYLYVCKIPVCPKSDASVVSWSASLRQGIFPADARSFSGCALQVGKSQLFNPDPTTCDNRLSTHVSSAHHVVPWPHKAKHIKKGFGVANGQSLGHKTCGYASGTLPFRTQACQSTSDQKLIYTDHPAISWDEDHPAISRATFHLIY